MDNKTQLKKEKKFEKARLRTSQLRLRRIVGILGVGMPFFLAIASFVCSDATTIKDSISAYYHSGLRDIFVGILCVVGMFLFAYKGYDAWDDRVSILAGLSAVGVALFPMECSHEVIKAMQHCPDEMTKVMKCPNEAINTMHYLFAIALFLTLAYFSRCRFTKSRCKSILKGTPKAKRNMVYKWCAYIIVSGLLAIGVFHRFKLSTIEVALHPILGDNKLVCYLSFIGLFVMLVLFLRWACLPWWRPIEQAKKNEIYEDCKFLVPLCLFAIGVGIWAQYCYESSFVFWVETVMLMAFGVSWFVKGDTLLRDDDEKKSSGCNDRNGSADENNSAEK